MAVTLDGNNLTVHQLLEKEKIVMSDIDAFESGQYKSKTSVLGSVRRWFLSCSEDSVTWNSSVAKGFKTKMAAGTTVTFACTEPPHNIGVTVYILSCDVVYESPNHRVFTLELKEAM
ncbi:hypothetical protein HY605_01830 [Candidatus Peregrinibacteria bacterium]|nr:hypothetical protein [Candidatus Peregrinibacteria bacterium]